jgi:hypothetical protein
VEVENHDRPSADATGLETECCTLESPVVRQVFAKKEKACVSSGGCRPDRSARTMSGARYVARTCIDRLSRLTPRRCDIASMVSSHPS